MPNHNAGETGGLQWERDAVHSHVLWARSLSGEVQLSPPEGAYGALTQFAVVAGIPAGANVVVSAALSMANRYPEMGIPITIGAAWVAFHHPFALSLEETPTGPRLRYRLADEGECGVLPSTWQIGSTILVADLVKYPGILVTGSRGYMDYVRDGISRTSTARRVIGTGPNNSWTMPRDYHNQCVVRIVALPAWCPPPRPIVPRPVVVECTSMGVAGYSFTTPPEPAASVAPRRRYFQRVGVELEGGWNTDPGELADRPGAVSGRGTWNHGSGPRVQAGTDGSVTTNAEYDGREVRIGPYMRWRDVASTVLSCYPDHVNHTCGLHVHVSFRAGDYSRLMTPEFYAVFLQKWDEWGRTMGIPLAHPFWSRLAGSRYTERNQAGHFQVNMDRYRQLNFAAYQSHKTLECRMLPAFQDPRLAVLAIHRLLTMYEEYLWATREDNSVIVLDSAVAPQEPLIEVHSREIDTDEIVTQVRQRSLEQPPGLFERVPDGIRRYWIAGNPATPEDALRAALMV